MGYSDAQRYRVSSGGGVLVDLLVDLSGLVHDDLSERLSGSVRFLVNMLLWNRDTRFTFQRRQLTKPRSQKPAEALEPLLCFTRRTFL